IGTRFDRMKFIGPVSPRYLSPSFRPAVTLSVGLGVSDVQAVDTAGVGVLDLVVTNKLSGQLAILRSRGGGLFAPPHPHPAGAGPGLAALDVGGGSPGVASREATAGVASGPFTAGGPTDLVTITPGSNTIDLLAGLGGGRFANPVSLQGRSPAGVVRVTDTNH